MTKHLTVNHYVYVKEGKPRLNGFKSRYYCTELFCKTLQKQEGQAKTFPLFLQNCTNMLPEFNKLIKTKEKQDLTTQCHLVPKSEMTVHHLLSNELCWRFLCYPVHSVCPQEVSVQSRVISWWCLKIRLFIADVSAKECVTCKVKHEIQKKHQAIAKWRQYEQESKHLLALKAG